MPTRRAPYLLGLCLLLIGCQPERPSAPVGQQMEAPAGPGSGQPHLFAGPDERVGLSWIEPVDSSRDAFQYAAFDGSSWSEPKTVATGTDWFVNWADVPSLRPLPDGRHVAHYLESSGPGVFAYDVRLTQATPDGNWQPAVTPHRDGTPTEHGFVSLLPWQDDVLAVWLDGRQMDPDAGGHGGGPMTLRSALLTPDGQIEQATLLDDRVCECCPTSAVRTAEGALVAYRNRSANEIRNIGLIRFDGTQWSDPYLLHDDGWQINGCPVNGPALAANGARVVAAWFTAPDGSPRVQAAFSDNSGRRFGDPVVIDGNRPTGRVDVVLLDDGSALVSWIGQDEDGSALRVRHVQPDGTAGRPRTVATVSRSRATGMPRMVRAGDRVYWAWVGERGEASQVQVAHAALDALR